jgi:hypothetical protein
MLLCFPCIKPSHPPPPIFFLCSASASPPHLDTTATPSCRGTQVESHPLHLVVELAFEPWLERACELVVCLVARCLLAPLRRPAVA